MKVEIIIVLSALASHAAGSPLAARSGRRGAPSRLPFIARLPQGSTTPCYQRIGFGRSRTRLPFLALPANSRTNITPEGRGRRAKDILPAMVRISGNSGNNDTSDTDISSDSDINDISTSVNTSDIADINDNDYKNNRNVTNTNYVADNRDDDYLNNDNINDVATVSQNNYVPKNSHNHNNNSSTTDIATVSDNNHVATISDMAKIGDIARNRNFSKFRGAAGKANRSGLRYEYDWYGWKPDQWDRDMDIPVSPPWYTRTTWYPGWEDFFDNHTTTVIPHRPTSCPFYKTSPKPEPTRMGMPHHADKQYEVTEPPCLDYYNPVYDLILTLCGHDFMDDMDLNCQARIEQVGLKKTGNDPSFGYY